MKKLLLISLLSALTTIASFAQTAEPSIQSLIFDQPFEVAMLSHQEMEETEGMTARKTKSL
ncbi:MAG: hypothetical protein Q4B71_03230 [Cardiobacteriaceae bacterium]|nr:hypothetical protein [Cardiobacteriaceae bacterium]